MTWPLFLVPVVVGLVAQGLKPFLNRGHYDEMKVAGQRLPRYGGMPSAHTAFAFSLATLVAMVDGFASVNFAIVASLVVYVLDDALRMRIFLSKHGEALRRLIGKLPEEEKRNYPALESRLGHRPKEVLAGALLGVFLTLLLMFFGGYLR